MRARWSGGIPAAVAGAGLAVGAAWAADGRTDLERCVALAPGAVNLSILPRGSADCLVIPPAARELRTIGQPDRCIVIDGTTIGRGASGSATCTRAVDQDGVQVLRGGGEACLGVNSAAGALTVLSRKGRGCLGVDRSTGRVAAVDPTTGTLSPVGAPLPGATPRAVVIDPATGTLSPVGAPLPGRRPGSTAIDPTTGTLSPVGSVPRPIRVAEPSGEWLIDDRSRWGATDRIAVRVGVTYGQWDVAGVSSGTLVDGGVGTEREATHSEDTVDTWGADLRMRTPYGDVTFVYEEGDAHDAVTEPVGGAQIGFVYHTPSATGSLGLNTGRTGGEFRVDTDLRFAGARYAFPFSLYRREGDDCKIDFRAVLAASRLRLRYDAWQGNTTVPTIYSEARQEVEEDRYGAGVRGVYAQRLSDAIVGRFVLDLDLYYRKATLDSEQRNACGAPGCPPAATFTATVHDEDTGFAWGAGLGAALDYDLSRKARVSLTAGYRHHGESVQLVNPVRTIDFDGPPRLADRDVGVWRLGVAYRYTFD
ncbi:MAG: hypothetical protein KJ018_11600 [Burkholderiales bacterium]|nr:hypothetical protein [Burkholderiales bacterium]